MSEKQQLATIRVLCLVGDAYEDLELWYPKLRIEEAGGHVTLAGCQQGGRAWVEPAPQEEGSVVVGLTPADFGVAAQLVFGVPHSGLPFQAACRVCGAQPAGAYCAASHPHVLGQHLHSSVVRAVGRMFQAHGYAVRLGGETQGSVPHSADVTVLHYRGPGRHLRIEVKTGAEFGSSNLQVHGASGYCVARERQAHRQHAPLPVRPVVVTAAGGMGPSGAALIRELGRRHAATAFPGSGFSWTVPSHGKYWHRYLRSQALAGWAAALRMTLGVEPVEPLDVSVPRQQAELDTELEELQAGLDSGRPSVALAFCPACEEPRASCACQCSQCGFCPGGPGRWPGCTACGQCRSCCSCFF